MLNHYFLYFGLKSDVSIQCTVYFCDSFFSSKESANASCTVDLKKINTQRPTAVCGLITRTLSHGYVILNYTYGLEL